MLKRNHFVWITALVLMSLGEDLRGGRFLTPTTYPTGQLPVAAVLRDFNRDGVIDLATANQNGNDVSVLLGEGGGAFAAATSYPVGAGPFWVATGDWDGDGDDDLVVTNANAASLSLLLNNGDGTFGSSGSIAVQNLPRGLAVADVNHDHNLDLIVATRGLTLPDQGWAAVLLGNGDATFQNPVFYPAGQNPLRLRVADLNRDGQLDLAVADENATGTPDDLAILLGRGDGTFSAPLLSPTTGSSSDVAASDLNADGVLDLAIAGGDTRSVAIRLGNGDGTFQAPFITEIAGTARTVALADLDRDGILDLLIGGSAGTSVLLGRGGGSFAKPNIWGIGTQFVLTADLDRDHALDAVATGDLFSVSIAFGLGDGTFKAARVYSAETMIKSLAPGDFNRDGYPDVAAAKELPNSCALFQFSISGNRFSPKDPFGEIEPSHLIAADFNRDKHLDLSLTSTAANGSGVNIYLANRGGTFGEPTKFNPGADPLFQVAADFNHDRRIDLATANDASDTMSVLLGNGDGTFQAAVDYPAQRNPNVILATDFNRDGELDLALNNSSSARVAIYLGNGDGTFRDPLELVAVATVMVSGDFNHDQNPDLVLGGNPRLFLGNGDGTFQAGQFISFADGKLAASDINGDGNLDLLAAGNQLNLILGNGDGTFQTGVVYFSGALSEGELALADFNQDGAPDTLVTDRLENMSLLFNTGGSQVGLTSSSNPSTQGEEVVFTARITPTFPDTGAPTGRVTFKDGPTVLGTSRVRQGTAEFATSDLPAGENSISATYSGNEIFNRRPSPVLSQIVDEI